MMRESCLVCGSKELKQIINLGSHPFADTFVPQSKLGDADRVYPLICDLCIGCGHVQARYETNPMERYSHVDYSYTSSNSAFSRKHWDDYAKEVSGQLNLKPNSLVLEIGSNDGYLSEQFIKLGHKTIGVDPSPYMANLARERGVETTIGLFEDKIAGEIMRKHGKVDLVVANNVFNHSDYLRNFVIGVSNILSSGGSFVFEQPYWFDTIKSGKFDQIYHEHVSYFSVKPLQTLFANVGMVIKSARVVDYHGGSLRVVAQKDGKEISEEAQKMIEEEEKYGLFDASMYEKFMSKLLKDRSRFLQKIHKIKENGDSIIAVGAAAKGNTFLNFYKLDNSIIDYVTDASPHKKGKHTPATRIPIVGDEIFAQYNKVYALILSWNIANILKDKLHAINKNIEFLVPEEN